jgi:hypothetical protein
MIRSALAASMRWDGRAIYVRCRECQLPVVGPVTCIPVRAFRDGGELPLDLVVPADASGDVPISWPGPLPPGVDDLWVSADWVSAVQLERERDRGRRRRDRLGGMPQALDERGLGIRPTSYGCCGWNGGVVCASGHVVGSVHADCHQSFIALVLGSMTERTSRADGRWDIYEIEGGRAVRYNGIVKKGSPVGEWERCG